MFASYSVGDLHIFLIVQFLNVQKGFRLCLVVIELNIGNGSFVFHVQWIGKVPCNKDREEQWE